MSQAASRVSGSAVMEVVGRAQQLKAQGADIVSFAIGEPDFETPVFIKKAGKRAIDEGKTRYSPGAGIMDLRREIAAKLRRENGLDYVPEQVMVTVGAKNALYQALQAVVNPGEEVLLPAPYWVTYPEMIKLMGAIPRIIPTREEEGFKLQPVALKKAVTANSAAVILNSPNNPGGFCYGREELLALGRVIEETRLAVISDEVYEKLVYSSAESFQSFASAVPGLMDRTITINGFSKSYCMTGWRVGYAAGPQEVIEAMSRIQSQISLGTATFCQVAGISALRDGEAQVEQMRRQFAQRAQYIYQRLKSIPGLTCVEPAGAFYVFPNVSRFYSKLGVKGSLEFCRLLLEKAAVACVPGECFGMNDHVRISFATSMENIDKGMNRIEAFLSL
jgi:aspartate aminotransferase